MAAPAEKKPHYLLRYFSFKHLPPVFHETGRRFLELAEWIEQNHRENPEKTTALRKLLEAKDCAMRSIIFVK